jgi:hypothetical protein
VGAVKTSAVMLLTPEILPKPHHSSQLAKPMRIPPMAAK